MNIDEEIAAMSHDADYMSKLEKITGSITKINNKVYKHQLKKVAICLAVSIKSMNTLLNNKVCPELRSQVELFINLSSIVDRNNVYLHKIKVHKTKSHSDSKSIEYINPGCTPKEIINSAFFKTLRYIWKNVSKIVFAYDGTECESKTMALTKYRTKLRDHPEFLDIKYLFDMSEIKIDDYEQIYNIYKHLGRIIGVFMSPMYDVKNTIRSNFHIIKNLFKTSTQMENILNNNTTPIICEEQAEIADLCENPQSNVDFEQCGHVRAIEIINMIYMFVIVKYRAVITGKNKYYMLLFKNSPVANADMGTLMNVIDSISLDQFRDEFDVKIVEDLMQILEDSKNGKTVDINRIQALTLNMNSNAPVDKISESEINEMNVLSEFMDVKPNSVKSVEPTSDKSPGPIAG